MTDAPEDRWPIPHAARMLVIQYLLNVIDVEYVWERPEDQPGVRERLAAVKALALYDALNMRLVLSGGSGDTAAAWLRIAELADGIRHQRMRRLTCA